MPIKLIKRFLRYLETKSKHTADAQTEQAKSMQAKIARRLKSETDERVIAKLKKKSEKFAWGVFVGGPLDGRAVPRETLKSKRRYSILSGKWSDINVVVYERIKGSTTFHYVRAFGEDDSIHDWLKDHPQENWD